MGDESAWALRSHATPILQRGAIMQTPKWGVAPWMRRRIARHVERGTSERVLSCLVGMPGSLVSRSNATQAPDAAVTDCDMTNVIPFRSPHDLQAAPMIGPVGQSGVRVSESG